MDYLSLIVIAVGLSMDAFAVAITHGSTQPNIKMKNIIQAPLFFGFFQALMPVVGWLVGVAGTNIILSFDHWIAFGLLGFIGGKMIYEGLKKIKNPEIKKDTQANTSSTKYILLLSVATSIDALTTGIILPNVIGASSTILMIIAVSIIGTITFSICVVGILIGSKFGNKLSSKAEIVGGIVLILIGAKILIEHLIDHGFCI